MSIHQLRDKVMRHCFSVLGFVCAVLLPDLGHSQHSICGSVPEFDVKKEYAEATKGDLRGKAQVLSRFVGSTELAGRIETERKTIYQTSETSEATRKDAYLAYVFCVLIMDDKQLSMQDKLRAIQEFRKPLSSSKESAQYAFLERFTINTPLEKVREVFGVPIAQAKLPRFSTSRRKHGEVLLDQFQGDSIDFFVLSNRQKKFVGVGVLALERKHLARIPYLDMGTDKNGKESWFRLLGDFSLAFLQNECEGKVPFSHDRYGFLLSPVCYFGNPGGYKNYQFAFRFEETDVCDFEMRDLTGKNFDEVKCEGADSIRPSFVFVYFSDDAIKDNWAEEVVQFIIARGR